MRRALFAVSSLILAAAVPLQAQNPPAAGPPQLPAANGEVRGSVVDAEANTPVARATVAVRSKRDSSLVTGAIAGENGSFRIQGLRPGNYYLRITSIGYGPKLQDVAITAAAPVATVDAKLSRIAVALQSVEVQGERATVTIEPDRNTYKAKDVAPAAANASEVLDAVPSVQVDADGKVSYRGNENVAVQINGRPTPIRGPQLASYLKQLPANIVERVEVIPNPSARYDPEGMAGIINIVMKQSVDLGMSGGLTVGAANTDRYNASGNIGYQAGPWTLFTSYGFNSDDRDVIGINDRERYDALRVPRSITEQDLHGMTGNGGHNFTANADYRFNDRDVLSNALVLNRRRFSDASVTAITELDGDRSMLDQYVQGKNTRNKALMFDYTAAFKRTFEARKHELSTELRFNRTRDDELTGLWREPTSGSASRYLLEDDDTDALTRQAIGQLDYTRTLGERTKLETGYKGNTRWLDREFLVEKDSLGNGNWVRSNLSNDFQFDETVHALYGVLSQGAGKFELQGGLRAERADRNFALAQPAESYPFKYTSLFPSGLVMYKVSDATQLKASYSRRIRRPGTQELNPFPSFFDAQNVFFGNPQLNPEYTDAIELAYNRQGQLGSIQFSPFYRKTSDVIRVLINTADTVDGREVTSVSFENLAKSTSWGTDLNGSLRLGPKFNGFASFNIFRMVTDGGSLSSVSSDAVNWTARVNGTTQISPTLTLQGSYFYRAPMKIERGQFSRFQQTHISVRKKLQGDKASLAVRFVDPFNTTRFRVTAGDDNLTQITERAFGVRAIYTTFQYNFGRPPKLREPRTEAPVEQRPGFQ